jgi:HEAT repeat protein
MEEARVYIDRMRGRPSGEAIPKLIELLQDESWYLRERAGDALASFGAEAAPAVEELLRSGLWYTRAAALRVLGKIAAPRSLCLLVDMVTDGNRTIAETAARSLIGYCRSDRALAVAKILHGRGTTFRSDFLTRLLRVDPGSETRLRRLLDASDFMGPEGSLEQGDEQRLAEAISDRCWGIDWGRLDATEPLPEPPENLVRYLRGSVEP